jgi:MFS family permease
MLIRARQLWQEYPSKFWVVVVTAFIDVIGNTLIFPFFALYITQRFHVGMTQAGLLLGTFSVASLVGSVLGGALADKFGRRRMVLFGLVFSALSAVTMGLVDNLATFYGVAVVVGLLADMAGPARQAMVADILPEEQRAEGFGLLRVVANLSWIIGPTIGGLVASYSFLLLFVLDAIMSLITAVIVYKFLPETRPAMAEEEEKQSLAQTFIGYGVVLKDGAYIAFLLVSMLMAVVYLQLYSTLSVYLRDTHGIEAQGYGLLLSMNAGVVVLFQISLTRKTKNLAPMLMMAAGAGLYTIGFSLYGFTSTYAFFVVAMLFITFGEMIVVPVGQALAARFAPADMRGRYMAFYGMTFTIPQIIGPTAAGLIMDNGDPRWVWYLGGILCVVAVAGFYALHLRSGARLAINPSEPAAMIES